MSTIYNLKKEAIGWDWQVYRQTGWQWWKYDEIVNGQNQDWNNTVKTTPSLEGVLNEVTHEKQKYEEVFRHRYGVTNEQMKNIFFVFVGYHPGYGAYMNFIGPYVGSKPSDQQNKYAYFIRRFQKANPDETTRAFHDMLNKNFSDFSSILGPDDFKVVALSEMKERRGTKQWSKKHTEYKSADPNTPEGKKLYQEAPIFGKGSYFFPNAKGIYKMLIKASKEGNMDAALKDSIRRVAKESGIPEIEAVKMLQTDEAFVGKVFEIFKDIQLKAKQMGGPAAEQIKVIPDFYVMKKPTIGSQRTDALKTRPIQFSVLDLRKEILEAMVTSKISDPVKLSEFLNLKRSQDRIKSLKAKGQFTPQIVNYWLNEINRTRSVKDARGRFSRRKSDSELLGETSKEIEQLFENRSKKEEGFDDPETCMFMSSLFFAEVPPEFIDPNTRAKMISFEPKGKPAKPSKSTRSKKPEGAQLSFVIPTFSLPEGTPNITRTQLTEWRQQRSEQLEGISEEDIEVPTEESVEDEGVVEEKGMGEEVIPGQKKVPPQKPLVPDVLVPPKTTPSKKVPKPLPVTEEAEGTDVNRSRIKKVMTNALLSLVHIAKELDEEGKLEASESVHKVIRKYQERIK